jgi:hypothetical protein
MRQVRVGAARLHRVPYAGFDVGWDGGGGGYTKTHYPHISGIGHHDGFWGSDGMPGSIAQLGGPQGLKYIDS